MNQWFLLDKMDVIHWKSYSSYTSCQNLRKLAMKFIVTDVEFSQCESVIQHPSLWNTTIGIFRASVKPTCVITNLLNLVYYIYNEGCWVDCRDWLLWTVNNTFLMIATFMNEFHTLLMSVILRINFLLIKVFEKPGSEVKYTLLWQRAQHPSICNKSKHLLCNVCQNFQISD